MKRKVQANYVIGIDLLFREIILFRQDRNKILTRRFLCDGNVFNLALNPTVEHYVQKTNFRKSEFTVLYSDVLINTASGITLLGFVLRLKLRKPSLTLLRELTIFEKTRQRLLKVHLDVTQCHAIDVFEEWIFIFIMCWSRIGKLLSFIVTSFEIMQHQVPNKPSATKRLIQQISLLIIRVGLKSVGFIYHNHGL